MWVNDGMREKKLDGAIGEPGEQPSNGKAVSEPLRAKAWREERRRYFRVDAAICLKYKVIPADELPDKVERLENGLQDQFTVTASLSAITQQMRAHLKKIDQTLPVVAEYLRALERKMDLLAQALLAQDAEVVEQSSCEVSLSAVGMAFRSETPIRPGTILEIKMLLLPSFTGILTYGEVVNCKPEQATARAVSYRIGVDFSYIRENDRELLINHILKRQHETLRDQRDSKVPDST